MPVTPHHDTATTVNTSLIVAWPDGAGGYVSKPVSALYFKGGDTLYAVPFDAAGNPPAPDPSNPDPGAAHGYVAPAGAKPFAANTSDATIRAALGF